MSLKTRGMSEVASTRAVCLLGKGVQELRVPSPLPQLGHARAAPAPGKVSGEGGFGLTKARGRARAESPRPGVKDPPRPGTGRSMARALEPDVGAAHSATRPGPSAAPARAMGRLVGLSLLGIALGLVGERLLALR